MSNAGPPISPRNFYLNERHELARAQKDSGGRPAQYGQIDWAAKGVRLSKTLSEAKRVTLESKDPMKEKHFFMAALPVPAVPKITKSKNAPSEVYEEPTSYAGEHSRIFRRLGIDLINVSADGIATVHATAERFDKLLRTAEVLDEERAQERARWVTLDSFAPVPAEFRVDPGWLKSLKATAIADVVIEIQPLLSRAEAEEVILTIAKSLKSSADEALVGTGTDFSGRRWFRGRLRKGTLVDIAQNFFSVQALHPPFFVSLNAKDARSRSSANPRIQPKVVDVATLPTVAVFDTGVPAGHAVLSPYLRGTYRDPDAPAPFVLDHGSLVASRVVFGDVRDPADIPTPSCRYLDVMIAGDAGRIADKAVSPALDAVVATYPDVRVFNMSFGDVRPLAACDPIEQQERLALVRDLDNFVFARDVIVVVAAGNSRPGVAPAASYPDHIDQAEWQLGARPSGMNTLTCGSIVDVLDPRGMVKRMGWPSPFSRIGPGVARGPVPEYGAHGGNADDNWRWQPGLGVFGCSASGFWEDHSGTSFAAPLFARQAAFAIQLLQRYCAPMGQPYGVAVKAFLALTARRVEMPPAVSALADRTIGRGTASVARLQRPNGDSALFFWQGVIDGPDDRVRVQLPIPSQWLKSATKPVLRLVCAWDPPVNDAVRDIWVSRHVSVRLRPSQQGNALHGSRAAHASYPLIDRTYDLSAAKLAKVQPPPDDLWLVELSYEQVAEYFVAMTFAPQQRIAFVVELRDEGERPVSPQAAVQALPIAASMVRLSAPPAQVPTPVIIRHS